MIFAAIFVPLWLGCCLYAMRYGGAPERWVAALLLAAFPCSIALNRLQLRIDGANIGEALVDLILCAALIVIATRAHRLWPIAMAAMQILSLLSHLLQIAQPEHPFVLYWFTKTVWAYPMLVLLALATIRHRNRERRNGPEPSWSKSSPRSPAMRRRKQLGSSANFGD